MSKPDPKTKPVPTKQPAPAKKPADKPQTSSKPPEKPAAKKPPAPPAPPVKKPVSPPVATLPPGKKPVGQPVGPLPPGKKPTGKPASTPQVKKGAASSSSGPVTSKMDKSKFLAANGDSGASFDDGGEAIQNKFYREDPTADFYNPFSTPGQFSAKVLTSDNLLLQDMLLAKRTQPNATFLNPLVWLAQFAQSGRDPSADSEAATAVLSWFTQPFRPIFGLPASNTLFTSRFDGPSNGITLDRETSEAFRDALREIYWYADDDHLSQIAQLSDQEVMTHVHAWIDANGAIDLYAESVWHPRNLAPDASQTPPLFGATDYFLEIYSMTMRDRQQLLADLDSNLPELRDDLRWLASVNLTNQELRGIVVPTDRINLGAIGAGLEVAGAGLLSFGVTAPLGASLITIGGAIGVVDTSVTALERIRYKDWDGVLQVIGTEIFTQQFGGNDNPYVGPMLDFGLSIEENEDPERAAWQLNALMMALGQPPTYVPELIADQMQAYGYGNFPILASPTPTEEQLSDSNYIRAHGDLNNPIVYAFFLAAQYGEAGEEMAEYRRNVTVWSPPGMPSAAQPGMPDYIYRSMSPSFIYNNPHIDVWEGFSGQPYIYNEENLEYLQTASAGMYDAAMSRVDSDAELRAIFNLDEYARSQQERYFPPVPWNQDE